jgi:hypothetical protein
VDGNGGMFKRAGLFMLGVDIAYNIGSFSLSAPQTTQRRINDTEGSCETPKEAMRWVWISTGKMVLYNGFASMLAGSLWPLYGGLLVILDLHASYRYAIYCGMRDRMGKKLGGGRSAGAGAVASTPPPGDDDAKLSPPFVTDRVAGLVRRR